MNITPKTLKVLSKLHFSILIFFFAIAVGCLIIGVPLQLYDKYVINRDAECFVAIVEPSKDKDWVNVPIYNDYVRPTVIISIGSDGFIPDLAEEQKKCNVHTYESTKNEKFITLNIISDSTIIDNSPRPQVPAYFALFFFALSSLWFFLKKWLIWLDKE